MSKQAGDAAPRSKAPAIADATYAEGAAVLKPGCVYRGDVSERNVDGTYNINVTQPKAVVRNAQLALPVFGGLMGFNVNARLAVGSSVEFGYGNPSFIHAVLPDGNMDWLNARNRSMVWGDVMKSLAEGADIEQFTTTPQDMVEGEFEIANLFGVAMQFLFTMMRMSAGDRAAVECHLINDMVRVISQQYRHFSGIGEDLIFDHGRPTFERTWSSYRHELANKMSESEPLATMNKDAVDHASLDEKDRWEQIGRYRLLEFVGFAGDFIHSFVTDPPAAINKLAASPLYSGKSLIHRNSDGTLLLQSVADIKLERVVRIPVPKRIKHHEDPELTKSRKYRALQMPEVLRLPDLPQEDCFQLAYHLRSYSRWLSQVHSYARCLQLKDEYKVPSEKETDVPDWYCAEKDKIEQKNSMEYFDSYACITIVRDGSVLLHDVYGGSVMMSQSGIQISSARHIDIEAAGDIRIVAGRNLFMKVRRNIEITARIGGICITSYAWFKTICRAGTMWLRSDASKDSPDPVIEDGPTPEILDGHGIMIDATNGKTTMRSDQKIVLQVEGSGETGLDVETHDVELNTRTGNTRMIGNNVQAKAQDKLIGAGGQASSLKSPCLYGNVGEIDLGYGFFVKYGIINAKMLKTLTTFSNYIFSKRVGPQTDPDNPPKTPVGTHYNHTLELPDNEDVELEVGENEKGIEARGDAETTAAVMTTEYLEYKTKAAGPNWEFPPKDEYFWDKLPAPYVQTLTQQTIQKGDLVDSPSIGDAEWGEWDLQADTVQHGLRIGALRKGFGDGLEWYVTSAPGSASLRAPGNKPPTTLEIDWTLQTAKLYYLKS